MICFDLKHGGVCRIPALPSAAALGTFDGVHIGHAALIREAVSLRDSLISSGTPASAVVWSLFEVPKNLLSVGSAAVITDTDEKLELFASMGLDYALLEHFDDIKDMSCRDFVQDTLKRRLFCRYAVCGFNFRFGAGGVGDADALVRLCADAGMSAEVIPPVMQGSLTVSSSAIRLLLERGDTEGAEALLGRPFFIDFPVVHGKELGRAIGVPTINQNFPAGHVIPARGVYACTVSVDGKIFRGVANIGVRPTVDGDGEVNCETHIMDYSGLLYGRRIKVSFLRRLRGEERFGSLEELKARIALDITAASEYLSSRGF